MRKIGIPYVGGKRRMADEIVALLGYHDIYVEPFGGGGGVLLNKPVSRLDVYNDLDGMITNLFMVLACPETFEQFKRQLALLPGGRAIYEAMKARRGTHGVTAAVATYYCLYYGYNSTIGSPFAKPLMRCKYEAFLESVDMLDAVHARLARVVIDNFPWRFELERYGKRKGVKAAYVDPPYHPDSYKIPREALYNELMSREEHTELVDWLIADRTYNTIVVSGYDGDEYNRLCTEGGYARVESKKARREVLWVRTL